MNNLINTNSMYLSNIHGKTNSSNKAVFMVTVPYNDTYYFKSETAHEITIYDENEKHLVHGNDFSIDLVANKTYYIEVETLISNSNFYLDVKSHTNNIAVPYEMNLENDGSDIPTSGNNLVDPLAPALIETKKRPGGTYLYSNIPEATPIEAVDSILMQNKNLTGDCFITFEHQNCAGIPYFYMGYRLYNNTDHDVYVTLRNV